MPEGFTCNPVVCRKDAAAAASKRIGKDAAAAAAEGTGNESGATAERITAL